MTTAYDVGSCPHISLCYSVCVSCSHCICKILWRKTNAASFAPMLGVLAQRDITVFMGNGPVSITWPETPIQAQKCRCIPTGNRGIVWVVSILLSYTKSWYLLDLVPTDLFWPFLPCQRRRSRQVCDTGQLHSHCPQQLQGMKLFFLGHRKKQDCSGDLLPLSCCPFFLRGGWPIYELSEVTLVCRDPTESWN